MKNLNEDLDILKKFVENPSAMTSADQLQASMYSVLYGLAKIGRLYPVARVALVRAIQQLLREGW